MQLAESIKCKMPNNPFENRTMLCNINMDCMNLIFEEMDFTSLLNMVQTNKHISTIAVNVFRRKFSNKMISIEDYSDLPKQIEIFSNNWNWFGQRLKEIASERKTHFVSDEQIKIIDRKLIINTLKYFGCVIKKLKITYANIDLIESKLITRYLNKYCSDSLTELQLENCGGNILKYMNRPFKNVEHLTFGQRLLDVSNETPLMNQTFPNVQRLSLDLTEFSSQYPGCHLPHLIHLDLNINDLRDESNVIKVIESNPYVRSINLRSISPNILEIISKMQPNLQNLTNSMFPYGVNRIHFTNVVTFKVEDSLTSPSNFSFSNLKDVRMNCYGEQCNNWIDFVRDHNNLSRFYIGYSDMNDLQFERLSDLPNLVEMVIEHLQRNFFAIDTVVRFLNTHPNLQTFKLGSCQDSDKKTFKQSLEKEWETSDYHKCLSFERRR